MKYCIVSPCCSDAFFNATNYTGMGIEDWDVSGVETAFRMFFNASSFNAPIGSWDVSNIENFESMFQWAESFNQPLSNWNLRSAVNLDFMFEDATSFNQDLQSWDVSRVQSMNFMFGNATSFNQNLCAWGEKVDAFELETERMFEQSGCEEEDSPSLARNPSGPWCVFCGSLAPTPVPLTTRSPTGAPTITATPTMTMAPTGPTVSPVSVENIDLGSGARTTWPVAVLSIASAMSFLAVLV